MTTKPETLSDTSNPPLACSRKRHILLFVGLAIASCIVILLLLYFRPGAGKTPSETVLGQITTGQVAQKPQRAAPSLVPSVPMIDHLGLGLCEGDSIRYYFTQKIHITLLGASSPVKLPEVDSIPTPSVEMQMECQTMLLMKVYRAEKNGWIVGFQMQNPVVTLQAAPVSEHIPNKVLAEALGGEIMALVQGDGRLARLRMPDAMPLEARNVWKDVLARWQIVLPSQPDSLKWTSREEDTTGVYFASYIRRTRKLPIEMMKSKKCYLTVHMTNQENTKVTTTVTGDTAITLAPFQTIIVGKEDLKIVHNTLGIVVLSAVEFSFRMDERSHDPGLAAAADTATKVRSLTGMITPNASALQSELPDNVAMDGETSEVANQDTIDEALSALDNLVKQGQARTPAEVECMDRLRKLVNANDATADAIFERLAQDNCDPELASSLMGILGAAGTPMAQATMLAIFTGEDWPPSMRELAFSSFVQVKSPILGVDSALQAIYEKGGVYARNALLVLGAVANRISQTDEERFAKLSDYIIAENNKVDLDSDAKMVRLAAIGNLGPKEIPSCVLTMLKETDDVVRQSAVLALERITTTQATDIIKQTLAEDISENVRAAAATLLRESTREGAIINLTTSVKTDTSEAVRRAALLSLVEWIPMEPQAEEAIQTAASNDVSEDIRKLAQGLLAGRTVK